jgi:hypothetical protein
MRSVPGDGKGATFATPGRGPGPGPLGDDAVTTVEGAQRADAKDQGFGSAHNGIMLAVFGDGSVRSVRVDIDNAPGGTLFRLGCRDDGETIDPSSYN